MDITKSVELLDLNSLSPNSVIIVKIPKGYVDVHPHSLSREFAELTNRHETVLKEKRISFFLMDERITLQTITEQEMNENGWYKK